MSTSDDIVYLRARVCSESEQEFAGRQCTLIEPVSKSGAAMQGGWVFFVPTEWLITLEDMKKAVKR